MIVDNLKNCILYEKIHKDFAKVFEVLKTLSKDSEVEKKVIEEGSVWVLPPSVISDSDAPKIFEAHRDFIDIHYIISGEEKFGYSNIERLVQVKEYDNHEDYELLEGEKDFITLKEGDFCIVFPQDAHIPAFQKVGETELIRVVAKIRC